MILVIYESSLLHMKTIQNTFVGSGIPFLNDRLFGRTVIRFRIGRIRDTRISFARRAIFEKVVILLRIL